MGFRMVSGGYLGLVGLVGFNSALNKSLDTWYGFLE